MKRITASTAVLTLALLLLLSACGPSSTQAEKKELKTLNEKVSYVAGLDIGNTLKASETDVDLPILIQGIEDSFQGREPLIKPEEAAVVKQEYTRKVMEEYQKKSKVIGEKNKKEGEAFLAENKKKPGVATTESGLQYMVLKEGNGPRPKLDDQVKVNYVGTLLDGTEFDSSYRRGQPATFPLIGVIRGWTEGLQLMPVGGKYRFFIPPDLAYGEHGAGQVVGPDATLIFEIELLEIIVQPGIQPGTKPGEQEKK